ncbi:cbb3-type cytochrome c oxidase N-terminal domain-containing protein [Neolewinella agarilytica]|uniref:Cytochrome c oxidase cbb3-type subunit 3 n=1 Tax=Neolewinella agarilytica TaxID=478744 RepID=A0A1H9ENQ3_9BACT|nr:cbb3-type cytochrome c oxidase N-terminal domain-containing protein [Neolewinella agarilytica]SEQ27350.1 cytochrome c oxidase cbb3-type subunit 3 [Neolewinella agarilytica]
MNYLLLQVETAVPEAVSTGLFDALSPLEKLLFTMILLVLFAGGWSIMNLSNSLVQMQKARLLAKVDPEILKEVGIEAVAPTIPWWKKVYDRMTDYVPLEKEQDFLLDHDYDGVQELDNNLPPWWKGVFYISMAFAPIYIYAVHFSDYAMSSREAYAVEMEVAAEEVKAYLATQKNAVDETNVTYLADADALSNGKIIFDSKCAVCHGKEGEGGIGPNFTDSYWLHGGSIGDIFKTIKNGVPEKGMIPWKSELRPSAMQEVASYIISLEGTSPANPKDPQGEPYDRSAEETEVTSSK